MKKITAIPANGTSHILFRANEGIAQLNNLIEQYNNNTSVSEKFEILMEINQHQNRIINIFPADFMIDFQTFQQEMQVDLFKEIKAECAKLDVRSLYQPSLDNAEFTRATTVTKKQATEFNNLLANKKNAGKAFFGRTKGLDDIKAFIRTIPKESTSPRDMHQELMRLRKMTRTWIAEHPGASPESVQHLRLLIAATTAKIQDLQKKHPDLSPSTSNSFADFIANMAPEKAAQMAGILAKGSPYHIGLARLYAPGEPGARTFKQLLDSHEIEFLGGSNSKNFKITNTVNKREYVLKVENRLDAPRFLEDKLADSAMKDTLVTVFANRSTSIVDADEDTIGVNLQVTEFCRGGDLVDHSKRHSNDAGRMKAAASLYQQQAQMMMDMARENVACSDLKNTNGLVDAHGKLRMADTKALLPVTGGMVNNLHGDNQRFEILSTTYIDPPEVRRAKNLAETSRQFSYQADPANAWVLGKNLYQYLSGCDIQYLHVNHDGKRFDFSAPVFQTDEGRECQRLIEGLVQPDPKNRMPVAEALQALTVMDQRLNPVAQASTAAVAASSSVPLPAKEEKTSLNPHRGTRRTRKPVDSTNEPELSAPTQTTPPDPLLKKENNLSFIKPLRRLLGGKKAKNPAQQASSEAEQSDPAMSAPVSTIQAPGAPIDQSREILKLKNECLELVREIGELEKQQGKAVTQYTDAIGAARGVPGLEALRDNLSSKYSDEARQTAQLTKDCEDLLGRIGKLAVGSNDIQMDHYVADIRRRMEQPGVNLAALKKELTETEKSANSVDVQLIKETIENYTGKKGLFSVDKDKKAERIENALAEVPVHKRGKIFEDSENNNPAVLAVRIELARHRYLGKHDKIYMTGDQVDENKAASTFRSIKDRVMDIKNQQKPDDPEQTAVSDTRYKPR